MDEPHPLDDPVRKRRTVRLLVLLAPVLFVFCYLLAWAQGAEPRHAALIGTVGAGMSASAALAIHVMGPKSWMALVMVKVLAALLARR